MARDGSDHAGLPKQHWRWGVGKRTAHIVPVLLSCSCDGADDDALALHFLKTSVCLEDLTLETFSGGGWLEMLENIISREGWEPAETSPLWISEAVN